MSWRFVRVACSIVGAAALALPLAGGAQQPPPQDDAAEQQAQRQITQPGNNAPVWRDVRSGDPGYTSIKGPETNVLIQPTMQLPGQPRVTGGEAWRLFRNGPVSLYGGIALVALVLLIAGYYAWKGTIPLHEPLTGRRIRRFSAWERTIHWSTAISFCVLAISGLIIVFGKHVLLPVLGYTLFAWLTQIAKNLHNFVGPLFIVCSILLFFTFVKDNVPRAYDWLWIRKFGGLFGGHEPASHRFNAGEKAWFWGGLSLLGIVVGASGLVLDFPNFGQTRQTMQIANLIHLVGALLFILGSLGHIYMGTLGMAGAFKAMKTGEVDEAWAKAAPRILVCGRQIGKDPHRSRSRRVGIARGAAFEGGARMKAAITGTICLALIAGPLWAKLPAPPPMNEEQKAAAAAKAAKAAEAAKKEAELLAKYQDLTTEKYKKELAAKAARATPAAKAAPVAAKK